VALSPVHVVQRSDGVWQVEHEDEVVPVSLHESRDEALDAALQVARREHRALALHRHARPPVRWVDRVARAMLDRQERWNRRRAG
jgi:hypothetical protein